MIDVSHMMRASVTASRHKLLLPYTTMPAQGKSSASNVKFSTPDTALTVLGTTLQIAKDVGEALEGIPYVKSVAGILVQILKIREEIQHLKEFSKELIELIAARALPILRGLEALESKPRPGLDSLKDDLEAYHCVLNDVYYELARLTTRQRFFVLHRDEIKSNLERHRRKLEDIHATFTVSRLTGMTQLLVEVHAKMDHTASIGHGILPEPLPAPRTLLIGRKTEVEANLLLLKSRGNPHIAIVGSGGMGKTSIAITLLHHPDMVDLFPTSRYFVSCEQVTTFPALLNAIADVISIPPAERGPTLQRDVLQRLGSVPTLLCLDNFEDPWDALGERRPIEIFLEHLNSLPQLGLILTTRVSERPSCISWTNRSSDDLQPLHEDDAVELFQHISESSDSNIPTVVNAVDRLPLAIELLARQVQRDSFARFFKDWESEGLKMLDGDFGQDHRLSSVYASIRLSLLSLRIANHRSASTVLGLLATLPDGLACSMVVHVQSALPSNTYLLQSLRVLCSASLVYEDSEERYRILAPIRHYAEEHIVPECDLMRGLTYAFAKLINEDPIPSNSTHFHSTARELSNAEAMILRGLPLWEDDPQLADILWASIDLSFWQHYVARLNLDVLRTALRHASTPYMQGRCYRTLGRMLYQLHDLNEAERHLLKALDLFHTIGEVYSEALTWLDLGDVHSDMERWAQSESDLKSALVMLRHVGDRSFEARVLMSLGCAFWQDGSVRYGDAEASLLHVLAISAEISEPSEAQFRLGVLYYHCFRFDEAEAHLLRAVQHAKHTNYTLGQARCHRYLGQVYTAKHVQPAAEASFQEAVILFRQIKDTNSVKWCLDRLERLPFDLSSDPPEPVMWEPVEEPYEVFIARILDGHTIQYPADVLRERTPSPPVPIAALTEQISGNQTEEADDVPDVPPAR